MFPYQNIHQYTWTSCDGKIDHTLIHTRWHLSIRDVWSCRGGDCGTDHYLLVTKVRRFNLRKLNELEVRKQCQTEITNKFAALENLSNGEDINRVWENFKENIKTSAKESLCLHKLKLQKPRFDEECLCFLDQRKQAKMQWVQDPSQNYVGNLNNIRCQASRHFTKRRHIWKLNLRKFTLTVR